MNGRLLQRLGRPSHVGHGYAIASLSTTFSLNSLYRNRRKPPTTPSWRSLTTRPHPRPTTPFSAPAKRPQLLLLLHHGALPAATPPTRRHFSSIEPIIRTGHDVLLSLHDFAPWWLAIPLFGALLSLAVRAPFMLAAHRVRRRASQLAILRAAAARGAVRVGPEKARKKQLKQAAKEFDKEFGVQSWRYQWLPALSLPAWFVGQEVVRNVVGGQVGLIGMLGGLGGGGMYGGVPGLDGEGVLWFVDLTAPDPLRVMPVALGLAMLWRFAPRTVAGWRELLVLEDKWSQRSLGRVFQRYFVVFCFVVPMALWDAGVAMQLYWLATIGSSMGLSSLIRWWKPDIYRDRTRALLGGSAYQAVANKGYVESQFKWYLLNRRR